MNQKLEITRYLINELSLKGKEKNWINVIWQNPRLKEKGGLKLTERGFDLFVRGQIKFYEIILENQILKFDNKFVLWLDNTFNCPFYLTHKKIYFFNEKPAVQLVLFSGNIEKYFQAHTKFNKSLIDKTEV